MVAGFRPAWWNSDALKSKVKPAESLFCTAANSSDPSKIGPNDQNKPGLGACTRDDLKCWWNQPVKWKECVIGECGNEVIRFPDTYKEEADGTAYPPNCTTQGLPANALIVDDVPDGTPISRPGCTQPKANSGTFSLDFATPSARIDFQQLGAGYGGHFWFAHTRKGDEAGNRMKVTGTWQTTNQPIGQREVFVHLPDHGAQEPQATYEIETRWGTQAKTISQKGSGNRWVSLGYYDFGDRLAVRLSTTVQGATGDLDLAYDAVAFAPSDYSPLPQMSLPEPNPNSLPDFSYDIPEEYDSSGPQLHSSGSSAPRCQSPNSQGKYM
ncbi:hypothetical protein ACFVT6_40640 [Streptomyces sp. NPDC058049]|uniref:golvesin C-terminal-like domain-containing protein n=1 Tax=Streptomyces sp. NPDC058049 TaxID=3346314 RepID=UPI0036F0A6CB